MKNTPLIHCIENAGHTADVQKICFGIADLGRQAMLFEEMAFFYHYIRKIQEKLAYNENILPEGSQHNSQEIVNMLAFLQESDFSQPREPHTAFLEKKRKFLSEGAEQNVSSSLCVRLELLGKPYQREVFCGLYSENELTTMFKELREKIIAPFGQRFALSISNNAHAVSITYDNAYWVYVDLKSLPVLRHLQNDQQIAKLIMQAFSPEEVRSFKFLKIEVDTLGRNKQDKESNTHVKEEDTQKEIQLGKLWKETAGWIKANFLTSEKKVWKDLSGVTLFHFAVQGGDVSLVERLLQSKFTKVNAVNAAKETALHFAARQGHTDVVLSLLYNWAAVDMRNRRGETALHLAARQGHMEIVTYLRQKKAAVNAKNIVGNTALHMAAENGHTEVVKRLLHNEVVDTRLLSKKATIDAVNIAGETALHLATRQGNAEVVAYLLYKGAVVDARNAAGDTALHMAAENGHPVVVMCLLNYRAAMNAVNATGNTALYLAAKKGCVDTLRCLLKSGAAVEINNNEGKIALHIAAENGHAEVVWWLLERRTQDIYGLQVLPVAARLGHTKVVACLLKGGIIVSDQNQQGILALLYATYAKHADVVKLLLEAGVAVQQKKHGVFALHCAAEEGSIDIVSFLVEAGVSVNCRINGMRLLHVAAKNGHTETVRCLLAYGAEVNGKNSRGQTAIHYAIMFGHVAVAELLLKNGASIKDKDIAGNTVLHFAAHLGRIEMVLCLSDSELDVHAENDAKETALQIAERNRHFEISNYLSQYASAIDRGDIKEKTPHDPTIALFPQKINMLNKIEHTAEQTDAEKYQDTQQPAYQNALLQWKQEHKALFLEQQYKEIIWSTNYMEEGVGDHLEKAERVAKKSQQKSSIGRRNRRGF